MAPFHVHLQSQSLTDLFDAVTASPASDTIVLHIPATECPSFLLHYSVAAEASHHHERQQTSLEGVSVEETKSQLILTAGMLGKICEVLFTRPAGAIAVVERPSVSTKDLGDEDGEKSAVPLFCSGPSLALVGACKYRIFNLGGAGAAKTKNSSSDGSARKEEQEVQLWFGDTAAAGVPCYGGLTHTLREWLGTGVSISMLAQAMMLPLSAVVRAATNTVRTAGSGETELALVVEKHVATEAAAGRSPSTAGAAVRLAQGYGTIFSGVAWLRARKAQRVHLAIAAQTRGRRSVAEKELLKLLIGERAVKPSSFKAVLAAEAVTLERALSAVIAAGLDGPRAVAQHHHSAVSGLSVLSIVARNFFRPVPNLFHSVCRQKLPSVSVFNAVQPDTTSLSIFLQRRFDQRLAPSSQCVQVLSLNQAMSQLALEAETHHQSAAVAASSSSPALQRVASILLWDVPLFADPAQSPDGNADQGTPRSRVLTELTTRCYLPEIRLHAQMPSRREQEQLLEKMVAVLRESSSRMLKPVVVTSAVGGGGFASATSSSSSSLVSVFPGLRLFAESLRQAMICIEDGALPVVAHKALQREGGMTPTVLQRVDRDGDAQSALELLSSLAAVAPEENSFGNFSSSSSIHGSGSNNHTVSSSSSSSSVMSRRRPGTALFAEMVKRRSHERSSAACRFNHLFRDKAGTRLDDLPLHRLLFAVNAQQQRQRRFFSTDEVVNRVVCAGASFPFGRCAQQIEGGVGEADRLAGAVLGMAPYLGGSPVKYCALQQIRTLESGKRAVATAAQKNKSKTTRPPHLDFAARMQLWTSKTVLGPEIIDPVPLQLVASLRSLGGAPVILQAKM